MINSLNLIHAFKLTQAIQSVGLKEISYSYGEHTNYKSNETKQYLYVDLWNKEKILKEHNLTFDQLINLIAYNVENYFAKLYKLEMLDYEISNELDKITFFL